MQNIVTVELLEALYRLNPAIGIEAAYRALDGAGDEVMVAAEFLDENGLFPQGDEDDLDRLPDEPLIQHFQQWKDDINSEPFNLLPIEEGLKLTA